MLNKISIPMLLCAAITLAVSISLGQSADLHALACSEHQQKTEAGPASTTSTETSPTQPATDTQPTDSQPSNQTAPSPEDQPKSTESTEALPDPILQGKTLMETRCSSCHPSPRANTHTMAEWPAVLKRMGRMASLKDEEIQLIQGYLESELKPQTRSDWESSDS